jgi:hypothetical protein
MSSFSTEVWEPLYFVDRPGNNSSSWCPSIYSLSLEGEGINGWTLNREIFDRPVSANSVTGVQNLHSKALGCIKQVSKLFDI